MKMKLIMVASALVLTGTLTGCATAPNVDAPKSFWQNKKQKVEVAKVPTSEAKATFYHEGPQGILDMAINEVMNNHMNHMLKSYNGSRLLANAQKTFLSILKKHHIETEAVGAIDQDKLPKSGMNSRKYAVKNYHVLSKKYGNNKLLTITVNMLGEVRQYYGFIPLDEPSAICAMTGRLVDLKDNGIIWRHTSISTMPINAPRSNKKNFYSALNSAVQDATLDLAANFVKNAR